MPRDLSQVSQPVKSRALATGAGYFERALLHPFARQLLDVGGAGRPVRAAAIAVCEADGRPSADRSCSCARRYARRARQRRGASSGSCAVIVSSSSAMMPRTGSCRYRVPSRSNSTAWMRAEASTGLGRLGPGGRRPRASRRGTVDDMYTPTSKWGQKSDKATTFVEARPDKHLRRVQNAARSSRRFKPCSGRPEVWPGGP